MAVAGPCGYVYVVFMGFTRGDQSKMVVARFQDLNNQEHDDPLQQFLRQYYGKAHAPL